MKKKLMVDKWEELTFIDRFLECAACNMHATLQEGIRLLYSILHQYIYAIYWWYFMELFLWKLLFWSIG
jgi:hypothetical protein